MNITKLRFRWKCFNCGTINIRSGVGTGTERSDREGSGGGGVGEILELMEQNEEIQDENIHLTQAVTFTTDI